MWAYAFISQILPVSFAQNLFFLAMLMKTQPKPGNNVWAPFPILQVIPLIEYSVLVAIAPYTVGTSYFMTVVASIRVLLFWPFLLATVLPRQLGTYLHSQKIQENNMRIYQTIAILSIAIFCIQTLSTLMYNGFSFGAVLAALNSDPSVSALGYDYILCLVSTGTWYVMTDNSLE